MSDTGDGDRCFGDVGGKDDFAGSDGCGLENPVLLGQGKCSVKREDPDLMFVNMYLGNLNMERKQQTLGILESSVKAYSSIDF